MTKNISIKLLDFNKGQLAGLPKNPRFFRDYRFEAMKKSISDSPEMLDLRELIVFPSEGRYIVVCGNAISDDNALYPLIPKYDEKHELFIIISGNEVDSNWLRERLDMQHMKSYKTGKISKSNVIDIKDVRHALQNSNSKP